MFLALFLINIDTIWRNLLLNITRQVEAHQQLNVSFQQKVEEEVGSSRVRRSLPVIRDCPVPAPHNFLLHRELQSHHTLSYMSRSSQGSGGIVLSINPPGFLAGTERTRKYFYFLQFHAQNTSVQVQDGDRERHGQFCGTELHPR